MINERICPGQLVYWRNNAYIVLELKSFSELILRGLEEHTTEIAPIGEISLSKPLDGHMAKYPHLSAQDKDWDTAMKRFEIIKPLLDIPARTMENVQSVAKDADKSMTTVYRWLKQFEETGLVSSLLRQPRSDKGIKKLSQEVEEIIAIEMKKYKNEQRINVAKFYRDVKLACREADIEPPHKNTIYGRINNEDEREKVKTRYGAKKARQRFEPIRGEFPGGEYPNAVVQIDHTPVDLIVVDEEHRLPIGRPYLTIAIDIATKMISGFRMTLDPPGSMTAGLCIAHAVMKKDAWLAKRDIQADWPIYGLMRKIHVDNAKEFRGNMLKRACEENGIIIDFRPKGQPNYGGHVERAFRTFMEECHSLPGTTFSNVSQKLDYDSEGKACITLEELELWFTIFIVYSYHHRGHKGICDIAPIKLYEKYITGDANTVGIGMPQAVKDEEKFKLDFTPYNKITIQRNGVTWNHIIYNSDKLRRWIGLKDPEDNRKSRKYIFARDPRDISVIYFFEPDTETYIPIPYSNPTRPGISLWELREVTNRLKEDPINQINEDMIFEGYKKMREIEEQAIEKTRLAKQGRAKEKRHRRKKESRRAWQNIHENAPASLVTPDLNDDWGDDDIQPFSEIEVE